jgi:hypothetical protein
MQALRSELADLRAALAGPVPPGSGRGAPDADEAT